MILRRPMIESEYHDFFRQNSANHVREPMEEEELSQSVAEQETWKELSQMLPDGLRPEIPF